MEILQAGLHTILEKLVERIFLKIKAYFLEVIILLIVTNLSTWLYTDVVWGKMMLITPGT